MDTDDWAAFSAGHDEAPAEDEQRQAGLAHIAQSLGYFRKALLNEGFTPQDAADIVRDYFNSLMDAGALTAHDDDE